MVEMNRYFNTDNDNQSSYWFPDDDRRNLDAYDELMFDCYRNEDNIKDPYEQDPEFQRKMKELEITLEEKRQEEMKEEEILYVRKWTNTGLQIIALITEHLISHPFIVLRRQCQVNNKLARFHLIPVTLVPVVINIHRWQGITCLWKGVGSILVIKGLTLAVQDLVSKITLWPKEISVDSSSKYIGRHITLQFLTYAIITPFYSASLLETVQSEIACEKPEFLDIFKEGVGRIISFGLPQKGRMLPVWSLIIPTAAYFILKHLFKLIIKTVISKVLILNQDLQLRKQGAIPKDSHFIDNQNIELSSSLMAVLSTDIVLYPLETILHRLHLQGTRTIIDNLDDGLSVTPILTNFEGVMDCYETTVREEGASGLYKGFGALILQCITYTSIIKLSKFVFTQVSILFCKNDNSYQEKSRQYSDTKFINISKKVPAIKKETSMKCDFISHPDSSKESRHDPYQDKSKLQLDVEPRRIHETIMKSKNVSKIKDKAPKKYGHNFEESEYSFYRNE